ncbi:ABC transporter permease subunit, partial [Rhizobium ruizarguesonis]
YIEFSRGAPLALVLFLLYYGGPQFGLLLSPHVAGIVGLGLYGAGPFAEMKMPSSETPIVVTRPAAYNGISLTKSDIIVSP